MRKTIAIIELYQHDEVLRHYLELLQDSDYNIKVFCSKVVYECVEDLQGLTSFEWHIKDGEQNISDFLKEQEKQIKNSDLIFITTAQTHFKDFYRIAASTSTILLVHNAHSFLAPNQYLYFENKISDRLRWLMTSMNRVTLYKKKLLNVLKAIAFPESNILEYVTNNLKLPDNLNAVSLPFAFTEGNGYSKQDKIHILIPGTIDPRLRDYNIVLEGLQESLNGYKGNIEITLLGKPKGKGEQIILAFQQMKSSTFKVNSFQEYIAPNVYKNYLNKADFLILPLRENVQSHIYLERFGFSKISGGVNDAIRSQKPTLIPDFYPLSKGQQFLFESYNESNFSLLLNDWIKNRGFIKLKSKYDKGFERYKKEKMKADFLNEINSILM